jgi:eukaryotic-like serine/threonine-protein kinase
MKMALRSGRDSPQNAEASRAEAADSRAAKAGAYVGGDPSAADLDRLSRHFPQFDWIEYLGRGGMGIVFKARQPELDRLVAVKVLAPDVHEDPAFAERFTREARTLARLNHPNIVGFYDFGRSDEYVYLVMAYVNGFSLRELLNSERLQPEETMRIIRQLCEGLQYAHAEGIIHRDIKPENILIDVRGEVKIADFGLAKLMDQSATSIPLTGRWERVGTPDYMAPELILGSDVVDQRADIYSLGVVFYEMLTGELPNERLRGPLEPSLINPLLDEILLRMLESDPKRRFQRVEQLKAALAVFAGETIAPAWAPVEAKPPQASGALSFLRGRRLPAGCASMCLITLGIGLLGRWYLWRAESPQSSRSAPTRPSGMSFRPNQTQLR